MILSPVQVTLVIRYYYRRHHHQHQHRHYQYLYRYSLQRINLFIIKSS